MQFWKNVKEPRSLLKVGLASIAILAAVGLLLLPLLTVEAEETGGRSVDSPLLALMARQNATLGIILLGSVLVLVIVGGTLWVINQDRIHRPHLLHRKKEKSSQEETTS